MIDPHPVLLPDGRQVFFTPRAVMEKAKPLRAMFSPAPGALPTVPLPFDWSKNGTLQFPILGNDKYGCCMYDMAVHTDQTLTGNVGVEQSYDASSVIQSYLALNGGRDQGLDEQQITDEWHKGLCGNSDACIFDSLDIDPTNDNLVNSAMFLFGSVNFMLSVPSRWIVNAKQDAVWDAPAIANPMNGHGTMWNGVDAQGRKRLQTWGFNVWITPAGIRCCNPSAFVVASKRWFDPKTGMAPNGFSYDQLSAYWVACGGKAWPANPFPVAA